MAVSKEDILDAIGNMTVLEVVDLISAMEEKFGVTAAAAMVDVVTHEVGPLSALLLVLLPQPLDLGQDLLGAVAAGLPGGTGRLPPV